MGTRPKRTSIRLRRVPTERSLTEDFQQTIKKNLYEPFPQIFRAADLNLGFLFVKASSSGLPRNSC